MCDRSYAKCPFAIDAHSVESVCSLPIAIRKARCEQHLDIVSAVLQRCSYDCLSALGFCNSLQIGQHCHRTCLSSCVVLHKMLHDKAPETTKGKDRTVVDDVLKKLGSVEFVSVLDDALRHSAPVPHTHTQQNCKISYGGRQMRLANESDPDTRGSTCERNLVPDL